MGDPGDPSVSGEQMWEKFKSEGLKVDDELQEILKAMKYDNLSVLAKFSKDDQDSIVTFMRSTFHKITKAEDMKRFYGIFDANPDLFEFVGGQKKTIGFIIQMAKKLVTLSKQKSVANLFKASSPDNNSVSDKTVVATQESIASKIVEYAAQLEKSINAYLAENFEGTFNINNVNVAQDGLGSFIAKTPCPICPKETKITRNHTRWNTSNYYSHLRTHVAQPTNEKNSQKLDKFFTKSPTSTTAVRRKLVPRPEMGKKRLKVDKSKETERRYNSDEEEMLDIIESTDDYSLGPDSMSSQVSIEENQKKSSERQTDGKKDMGQQEEDCERLNDEKENEEQQKDQNEDEDEDFA